MAAITEATWLLAEEAAIGAGILDAPLLQSVATKAAQIILPAAGIYSERQEIASFIDFVTEGYEDVVVGAEDLVGGAKDYYEGLDRAVNESGDPEDGHEPNPYNPNKRPNDWNDDPQPKKFKIDSPSQFGPNQSKMIVSQGDSSHSAVPTASATQSSYPSANAFGANLLLSRHSKKLTPLVMNLGKRKRSDPFNGLLRSAFGSGQVTCQFNGRILSDMNKRGVACINFRHRLSKDYTDPDTTTSVTYPSYMANWILTPQPAQPFYIVPQLPSTTAATPTYDSTIAINPSSFRDMTAPFPLLDGSTQAQANSTERILTALPGQSFWVPYNRADYEDMSWNLNKLKLKPSRKKQAVAFNGNVTFSGTLALPGLIGTIKDPNDVTGVTQDFEDSFFNPVPLLMQSDHRRVSTMQYQNNAQTTIGYSSTDPFPVVEGISAPMAYDMVFKAGHCSFQFMNKGIGGLACNVVVFRTKKNHQTTGNIDEYNTVTQTAQHTEPPYVPYGQGTVPVGTPQGVNLQFMRMVGAMNTGNIRKLTGSYGTEFFQGRIPEPEDVYENPRFPFLPTLKHTPAALMDWVEVQRNCFALPSGDSRNLTIQFGGDIYNPASLPYASNANEYDRDVPASYTTSVVQASSTAPITDDHSYLVIISTQGDVGTSEYSVTEQGAVPQDPQMIGASYSPSNLQFYASYTEQIGACVCSSKAERSIWNNGKMLENKLPSDSIYSRSTVTLLDQSSAIRQPPIVAKTATPSTFSAVYTHGDNPSTDQADYYIAHNVKFAGTAPVNFGDAGTIGSLTGVPQSATYSG